MSNQRRTIPCITISKSDLLLVMSVMALTIRYRQRLTRENLEKVDMQMYRRLVEMESNNE